MTSKIVHNEFQMTHIGRRVLDVVLGNQDDRGLGSVGEAEFIEHIRIAIRNVGDDDIPPGGSGL